MPKRSFKAAFKDAQKYARLKRAKTVTVKSVKKIAQKVVNKNIDFQRSLQVTAGVPLEEGSSGGCVLWDKMQVPNGTGSEERAGNEIKLKSFKFRFEFKYYSKGCKVRLMCLKFNDYNGTSPPALSDFLSHPTYGLVSPWKKGGNVSYQVCYNKIISLGSSATTGSYMKTHQLRLTHKDFNKSSQLTSAGKKVEYASGTTAPPIKNRYVWYAMVDNGHSGTDIPSSTVFSSMGFTA